MRLSIGLLILLAGCAGRQEVITPPPKVEYRDRLVVQPIAPELLVEGEIAEGPPSEVFNVAARRRIELERVNANLRTIKEQQRNAPPPPG